jgi:hypothetical protein
MRVYQPFQRASLEPVQGAVLRAVGVVTLVGIGAIHFLQIVPTFEATPLLGAAYVVFITACLVVAAWLVSADDAYAWAAAGGVCAAALAGYVFTRVLNTPFDNQDVGNWACMLGMAALFVEVVMVALSVYAARLGAVTSQPVLTRSRPVQYRLGRDGAAREAG